ncbi:MAG: Ig-like domain-containing protein [Anaerolineales bacterium]
MAAKRSLWFRRVLWLLAIILLLAQACKLPAGLVARFKEPTATAALTPTPTRTPQPLPPAVVETEPARGSQIPLSGPITFYFNQAMDQASVEGAFRTGPATPGQLQWRDASTVTFTPDQDLKPGGTLAIVIDATARAANGLALLEPFQAEYSTPGYLKPTYVLPVSRGREVDPTAAIMVTFNQPVVALAREKEGGPQAFQISPSNAGEGEWVNTSTYLFSPQPALAGGEEYTVQLNSELTSTAGAPLAEGVQMEWMFTTLSPALLAHEPAAEAKNVPLDAPVVISFNQAMDKESFAAQFSLRDAQGGMVRGKVEWSEDLKTATFSPASLLARDRTYTAFLPGEVKAAGGTVLGTDETWQFSTVGDLQLVDSNPRQGASTTVHQGVMLYFNSPLDREKLEEKFTINPEITNLHTSWVPSDNALRITGDYAALESYTLTIAETLSDEWGSTLSRPVRLSFFTRAFSPNLVITQGTNDLFLSGEENAIPAQGTNLSSVLISVGTIPPEQYAAVLGPERYQALQNYVPPDNRSWWQAVNLPGNASYRFNLPLTPYGATLSPGLYRYRILSEDLPYNPAPFLLAVSHNHLVLKVSSNDVLVWAVDLRSGEPVVDAPIQIYSQEGQPLFSGRTDAQGVFSAEFYTPRNLYDTSFYAILGSPGEETFAVSSSSWQQGTEPYLFSLIADYDPDAFRTYLYTDRPIYRPGQTVYFRIVKRAVEAFGYALPEEEGVECALSGPEGELHTFQMDLSAYGTAHGQYQLPEFAEPGYYRLESGEGLITFQVAEYRKPEVDLEVKLSPEVVLKGESLTAAVDARYYFDAPAGNVALDWLISARPETFTLPGYQVGTLGDQTFAYPSPYSWGSFDVGVDSGEGETSRAGKWSLDFAAAGEGDYGQDISLPATYIFQATIQDESGFPISARAEVLVHPSTFYIGVKPEAWISKAGEEATFAVKVVDWEKNPEGLKYLKAELKKVSWERTGDAPYNITYQKQLELVSELDFRTESNGEARISFVPPQPGTYQLDVFGEEARTEVLMWVGGAGQVTWPALSNQRLQLVADQDVYRPGELAQIFIPNPFPAWSQALITVEGDHIHSISTARLEGNGTTISIPLSEAEIPNVYLSVTLLGKDEDGVLDFRQGYLDLQVEPTRQLLDVVLTGDPVRTKPGEEVTLDIQVADSEGQPVQGEFSLSVVDEAVLALTDPNAKDITDAFYGQRPLAVRLGLPMSIHAGREILLPGGIGGGGGAVVLPVRSQFPDTSYWNAEIVTDESGRAQVTVTLPDNLTTWQIQTRGITKDSKVGQATTDVITSKDLLVRPVTPRFLVVGDHLRFAAIVHNNTANDLSVEVAVQSEGVRLDTPSLAAQNVDVPAGGRERVEWWGTVEEVAEADLVFSARAGDLSDAVRPYQGPLPVLKYTVPRTYSTAGVLTEAGRRLEIIDLPKTFDPSSGSLDLELSPSLAAAMGTALDALGEEEYQSTIGMMSHLLPHLAAYRALREAGLENPDLKSRLDEALPEMLEEVAAAQNEDGGWGWWRGGESDPSITSYLLFGLTQAQDAGVVVEDQVIERAKGHLLATLPSPDMLTRSWQFDQLAFQYFALEAAGAENLSGEEKLYDFREQLSPWGKALTALVLEAETPGDERVATLFSNLEANAVQTATGAHWEEEDYPSRLHNTGTMTAIVTYALARHDPLARTIPPAVRYLISNRAPDGKWWSDYETAWSVLALTEVMKGTEEYRADYHFAASLNGEEILAGQAGGTTPVTSFGTSAPITHLNPERPNTLEIERGQGEGRLYYRSSLTISRPAAEVTPFGKGMSLSRAYSFAEEGDDLTFTQHGSTAELVRVHLNLSVESDTYYLKIEDTIPAGAEILDTRLKTTRRDQVAFDVSSPFRGGWGWWYFNAPHVYDDHITWTADFLPAGTYQLTYTLALNLPGEYQVLPARAWQVYFPEIQATSAGDEFIITTAQE